ncbi:MAG: symmetrical bis(5'-nucleosyl)-tetraphosphatase [Steroidobacteraceae bacterium]
MAVYAIGDLQGCHAEFMTLLEQLRFEPGRDRLWLTGDLVNRGPESLEVLRSVRSLGSSATVVLGNHDLHLLAMAWAPQMARRREPELQRVLDAPDADELLDWLAARPLLHRDRELRWTLIHAGLPPQWSLADAEVCARDLETALGESPADFLAHMYGDQPDSWSPALSGIERLRFAVNCLTRLRYVDIAGRLLLDHKGPPQQAPRQAIPWFRHPDRATRADRILFGHWSALGYLSEPGIRCLDAGCVWGGALCALRLDREEEALMLGCRGSRRPGA